MKPLIGIIMRPNINPNNKQLLVGFKEVCDAVIKNGGIPIGIFPPNIDDFYNKNYSNANKLTEEEFLDLKKIIDLCDGVICQGGRDFYDYDLKAIEYAYYSDIPLLGICLGMQAMSYLFNGDLVEVGSAKHQSNEDYVHKVVIDKNSYLFNILNESIISVNSRHNDRVLNTSLNVVGISDDGIIEAVEDKCKKFFIGVQWHPESMIDYDVLMNKLFKEFINTCQKNKNTF